MLMEPKDVRIRLSMVLFYSTSLYHSQTIRICIEFRLSSHNSSLKVDSEFFAWVQVKSGNTPHENVEFNIFTLNRTLIEFDFGVVLKFFFAVDPFQKGVVVVEDDELIDELAVVGVHPVDVVGVLGGVFFVGVDGVETGLLGVLAVAVVAEVEFDGLLDVAVEVVLVPEFDGSFVEGGEFESNAIITNLIRPQLDSIIWLNNLGISTIQSTNINQLHRKHRHSPWLHSRIHIYITMYRRVVPINTESLRIHLSELL